MDLTGFLADESAASTAPVVGLETLFTLVVRVDTPLGGITCNVSSGVQCPRVNGTVVRLSSVWNPEV